MREIPLSVIRNRGNLSTLQAIAHYLCDHPLGPGLTQHDAGTTLGITQQAIHKHLQNARRKRNDTPANDGE